MDIPHFTEEQKRRQDELFAEAERRKEFFSSPSRGDIEFQTDSGVRYFHQAGTNTLSVVKPLRAPKPRTASKPKIPQHDCKVDYYETIDAEGRVWQVEHRH